MAIPGPRSRDGLSGRVSRAAESKEACDPPPPHTHPTQYNTTPPPSTRDRTQAFYTYQAFLYTRQGLYN